jgi:hypothetical protein
MSEIATVVKAAAAEVGDEAAPAPAPAPAHAHARAPTPVETLQVKLD